MAGCDPLTDISVLTLAEPIAGLLRVRNTDAVLGEPGFAFGNPLGEFPETMTSGIVSGLGWSTDSPGGRTIEDALQIDAAINHGIARGGNSSRKPFRSKSGATAGALRSSASLTSWVDSPHANRVRPTFQTLLLLSRVFVVHGRWRSGRWGPVFAGGWAVGQNRDGPRRGAGQALMRSRRPWGLLLAEGGRSETGQSRWGRQLKRGPAHRLGGQRCRCRQRMISALLRPSARRRAT